MSVESIKYLEIALENVKKVYDDAVKAQNVCKARLETANNANINKIVRDYERVKRERHIAYGKMCGLILAIAAINTTTIQGSD